MSTIDVWRGVKEDRKYLLRIQEGGLYEDIPEVS